MLLFLLLIQQFHFTNHNFILVKFHLVEVFYFYFRRIILHYNKEGTVSWAGRNSGSWRGCSAQHMMGEQLHLSVIMPLISPGMQSHQDCILWGSGLAFGKRYHPTTMARALTNLYRPACREQPGSWVPPHLLWWNKWHTSSRCLGTTCTNNMHDPHPFLCVIV